MTASWDPAARIIRMVTRLLENKRTTEPDPVPEDFKAALAGLEHELELWRRVHSPLPYAVIDTWMNQDDLPVQPGQRTKLIARTSSVQEAENLVSLLADAPAGRYSIDGP